MKLLKTLVFALLPTILLGCETTRQTEILKQPDVTLQVKGDVNEEMADLWAAAAIHLSQEPSPSLDNATFLVPISSFGGRVDYMKKIISSMRHIKELGYKIQCVATIARSAAFMIWMECDERYVYQYGDLLFHYPLFGMRGETTYQDAKDMYESLAASRTVWLALLSNKLGRYFATEEIDMWALESKQWIGEEFCNKTPGYCAILK